MKLKICIKMILLLLSINMYSISEGEIKDENYEGVWSGIDIHKTNDKQEKKFLIIKRYDDKYFIIYYDFESEPNKRVIVGKYNEKNKTLIALDDSDFEIRIGLSSSLYNDEEIYFSFGPKGLFSPVDLIRTNEKDLELYNYNATSNNNEEIKDDYYSGIWSCTDNYEKGKNQTKTFLVIKKIKNKFFIIFLDFNHNELSRVFVGDYYEENNIIKGNEENKEEVIIGKSKNDKQIYFKTKKSEVNFNSVNEKDLEMYDYNIKEGDLTPTVNNLRLRESPSLNGKIIRSLKQGEKLEVLERGNIVDVNDVSGHWVKVKTEKGEVGWCFDAYLKEVK